MPGRDKINKIKYIIKEFPDVRDYICNEVSRHPDAYSSYFYVFCFVCMGIGVISSIAAKDYFDAGRKKMGMLWVLIGGFFYWLPIIIYLYCT